jgi:hypothetical protein
VVLGGEANPRANYLTLNGCRWNFVQLLAHEATHCYQLHRLGPWQMNPIVPQYPAWKLEGYTEYVARRGPNCLPLRQQVQQQNQAEQVTPHEWGIALADGTTASRAYANCFILTTYCLDVKKCPTGNC